MRGEPPVTSLNLSTERPLRDALGYFEFKMVPFLLIVLSLLWRTQGGLLFACAMWVLAFLYMRRLPPRLKGLPVAWLTVLVGMLCNAVVTVANGGYMPVAGLPSDIRPIFPTWIPAESTNYLVLLADQHYLFYFSVGDVLIISGVLLWFVGPWLLRRLNQFRAQRVAVQVADNPT